MSKDMIMGSIEFGPMTHSEFQAVDWSMMWEEKRKKDEDTLRELVQLRRQLVAARQWYDEEYPPEEGYDQVYPWDNA